MKKINVREQVPRTEWERNEVTSSLDIASDKNKKQKIRGVLDEGKCFVY